MKRDRNARLVEYLSLFRNGLNKFNNTRARMLYDIKITLKSLSAVRNVIILSLCTPCCYGRQNVSRKAVNHQWFIDFIAWRYITPRRDVIS